ncbi:MAG TPA: VCBS repeat-containing protein [Planctomycetota bacterium]|nr:VCBS repeat-containing protein [Planctomycetota bacterium]
MNRILSAALLLFTLGLAAGEGPAPVFEAQDVDTKVMIGYGLAIGDVDGDGKPDILLADKEQIVWYHNPDWTRHVICEKPSKLDNVCIAARDLDGDGKVEVAFGANWNPADTENSGSVHYLIAPADRKQKWEVVDLHREPTVHRMRWIQAKDNSFRLVVAPLHGRGNKNQAGVGVKILAYSKPANPKDAWTTELMDESLHVTHNFDPVKWDADAEDEVVLGGKEGVLLLDRGADKWTSTKLTESGAGEVRAGQFAPGKRFIATVEPFHGDKLCVFTPKDDPKAIWERRVIDEALKEGHALACADLLGIGSDQIVMGWRNPNAAQKVGINLYIPVDGGKEWRKVSVDENGMACEDLQVADLNGDGKLDIIAAGRATKNVKVYWNKTAKP